MKKDDVQEIEAGANVKLTTSFGTELEGSWSELKKDEYDQDVVSLNDGHLEIEADLVEEVEVSS